MLPLNGGFRYAPADASAMLATAKTTAMTATTTKITLNFPIVSSSKVSLQDGQQMGELRDDCLYNKEENQ